MITYGSMTITSYNSIVNTDVYYYQSSSPTELIDGSWSTTKPSWVNGKYVWQKFRTLYEDGTTSESDPVNITGQQGTKGADGVVYKLSCSNNVVTKSSDGAYLVSSILFYSQCKRGDEELTSYDGRFKLETSIDGINWRHDSAYDSIVDEHEKRYELPTEIQSIRCSLYQAGGTTVLLDQMTVPIIADGRDGKDLFESIQYYLVSDKSTGITIYSNEEDEKSGWQKETPTELEDGEFVWTYIMSRYNENGEPPQKQERNGKTIDIINHGASSPLDEMIVSFSPFQNTGTPSPENLIPIQNETWVGAIRYGKNLLKPDNLINPYIMNGVSYQINEDNTITINRTLESAEDSYFDIEIYDSDSLIDGIEYIASGFNNGTEGLENTVKIILLDKQGDVIDSFLEEECNFVYSPVSADFNTYRIWISASYSPVDLIISPMLRFNGALSDDPFYMPFERTWVEGYIGEVEDPVYGGIYNLTTGEIERTVIKKTFSTSSMDSTEDRPGWTNAGLKELGYEGSGTLTTMVNVGTKISYDCTDENDLLFLSPVDYDNKSQTDWKTLNIDIEVILPLISTDVVEATTQVFNLLNGHSTFVCQNDNMTITYYDNQEVIDPYIDYSLTMTLRSLTAAARAEEVARAAQASADEAQETADDAKKMAIDYLARDDTGIMVANLLDGDHTPSTAVGNNVYINDNSVNIRDGIDNIGTFAKTGIHYDTTVPYRIGNDITYLEYIDTDGDGDAETLRIVADTISFSSGENVKTQMDKLTDDVSSSLEKTDELRQDTQDTVNNIVNQVSVQGTKINEIQKNSNEIRKFIIIKPEVPSISVGTGEGVAVNILPDTINFVTDNNVSAYIANDNMRIPSATVTNLFMKTTNAYTGQDIGQIGWVMRSNGHLSLKIME